MFKFNSTAIFKEQRYEEIKKKYADSRRIFVDHEFPAEDAAIGSEPPKGVVWKRPNDICDGPKLYIEGVMNETFSEGLLGSQWLVTVCSCLEIEKDLWDKVVPEYRDQEWDFARQDNYTGAFHFQFCRFGRWVDVVVDDYLPTVDNAIVGAHSSVENKLWPVLFEKAYAKLHGSYERYKNGGNIVDALVDVSGGVVEQVNLKESGYPSNTQLKSELFLRLSSSMDDDALVCCNISHGELAESESCDTMGLVNERYYTVMDLQVVRLGKISIFPFIKEKDQTFVYLIRLRNPYGIKEWGGRWCDGSEEWNLVSEQERNRIGAMFDDDGQFWMEFNDWCDHFTNVIICRVPNTSYFSLRKKWFRSVYYGQWLKADTPLKNRAGGCPNYPTTFLQNPQYAFSVLKNNDEVLISVEQKDRRPFGKPNITIGFVVMKVEINCNHRIHTSRPIVNSTTYTKNRSTSLQCKMKIGRYVVMATTFEPYTQGEFLLRIYTGADSHSKELVLDCPDRTVLSRMFGYPVCVTSINVISASGLLSQRCVGVINPYAEVICEGESITTPVISHSVSPNWDTGVLFYRKDENTPIKIRIWNSNLMNEFIGEVLITGQVDEKTILYTDLPLYEKNNKKKRVPGFLNVQVSTHRTLTAI